jgi:hypothetical protein
VLIDWDVVDELTDTTISIAGDHKAVIWRKKGKDRLGRMSGRDREGMAQ